MKRLLLFPTRRPVVTLLVALLLVVLSVLLIGRLRAETSLNAMLDPSVPATAAMTKVLADFPVAEELLVLASLPDDTPPDRDKLRRFASDFSDLLKSEAADVVTNVRYQPSQDARRFVEEFVAPAGLLYLNDEQLKLAKLRLTEPAMRAQFQQNESMLAAPGPAAGGVAKAILRDPLRLYELLQNQLQERTPTNLAGDGFFSPTGRDLLVRIHGARPLSDLEFSKTFTARVTALAERANAGALTLRITGGYAIAAHNARVIQADAISESVSAVVMLAVVFAVLYRRPLLTFTIAFMPIAVGIVCGFGAYAMLRDSITPLAAVIGGALGGIGIDYSTHMLSHTHEGDKPVALVRRMAWPLLAACVTSVLGFAVIGYSPVRLLQDFALVGSLALVGAFVASLTVLPALLSLRPAVATPRATLLRSPWKNPRAVLTISLICLLPFAFVAAGVDLTKQDPDVHNLHPQPNPPLAAQAVVSQRMGLAGASLMIHVSAANPSDLLQKCANVQTALASSEATSVGVRHVFGPASLLPSPALAQERLKAFNPTDVEQILRSFDSAVATSSFSADAYRPYRGFLNKLLQPERAPDLGDLIKYAEISESILPRAGSTNQAVVHLFFDAPLDTRDAVRRVVERVSPLVDRIPGATLTGMSVVGQQMLTTVQRDLPRVALLAIGCVTLYLILHYRSFTFALLAIVPTLVSLTLLLAFMRVTGITLNVVNLVMVPLLLGINIDFGIFAADALRDPDERNLAGHFTASLRAITTCTLTAVVGFGSLAFTSVPAARSLGLLVAVGVIGCALGAALVLWPIVLLVARRRET